MSYLLSRVKTLGSDYSRRKRRGMREVDVQLLRSQSDRSMVEEMYPSGKPHSGENSRHTSATCHFSWEQPRRWTTIQGTQSL